MSDFMKSLAAEVAAEEARSNEGGSDRYLPLPKGTGMVQIHILPPLPGGRIAEKSHTHWVDNRVLVCRADHSGRFPSSGDCPFCDQASVIYRARKAAERAGDTARVASLTKKVGDYKAKERYSFNVWSPEFGVRIYNCGKQVRDLIVTGILGDARIGESGYGDVTDPAKSRPFKVVRDTSDGYPKYHKSKFVDISPLPADKVEAILAGRFDLTQETKVSSPEEVQAAFARVSGSGSPAAEPTSGDQAVDESEFHRLLGTM